MNENKAATIETLSTSGLSRENRRKVCNFVLKHSVPKADRYQFERAILVLPPPGITEENADGLSLEGEAFALPNVQAQGVEAVVSRMVAAMGDLYEIEEPATLCVAALLGDLGPSERARLLVLGFEDDGRAWMVVISVPPVSVLLANERAWCDVDAN